MAGGSTVVPLLYYTYTTGMLSTTPRLLLVKACPKIDLFVTKHSYHNNKLDKEENEEEVVEVRMGGGGGASYG